MHFFIANFMCISLHSQEKYQPFIQEMKEVYTRNLPEFQRKSEKAIKRYFKRQKKEMPQNIEYRFIPELLLKKSKTIYKDIDSTNLIQYLNPHSMYLEEAFVSVDSAYIGDIYSTYPKEEVFSGKPITKDHFYELVYKELIKISPDIVFTIQNVGEFFFIKRNKVFALTWEGNRIVKFDTYPIDEYTKKNKDLIFDAFFRYTPRVPYIEVY